jgi:hypothetical protein
VVQDIRKSIEIFQGFQALLVSPSNNNSSTKIKINVEHLWNDTDRAKSKYSEENLSQSHLAHHKT